MSRNATVWTYTGIIGQNPGHYQNNADKFRKFVQWYGDVSLAFPKILVLKGEPGTGKRTFYYHIKNLMSPKANYAILQKLRMDDCIESLTAQTKGHVFDCVNAEQSIIENIRDAINNTGKKQGAFRAFSKVAQVVGFKVKGESSGATYEFALAPDVTAFDKSTEATLHWLSNVCMSKPVVVMVQAGNDNGGTYRRIEQFLNSIQTFAARRIGIVVIDSTSDAPCINGGVPIVQLDFGELRENDITNLLQSIYITHHIRFEPRLGAALLDRGYLTYARAITAVSQIERLSPRELSINVLDRIEEG